MRVQHRGVFDTLSLEYFAVVARERSLNRAARILHASQPAVSRRIQQLEVDAGVRLLERHSAGVVLTSAGRTLARYADEIRRLSDEARHVMQLASGGSGKAIRIGFYQPATAVIVQLLRALQLEHPEIEVEPIEDTRTEVIQSLRKGEIDIAFPGFVRSEVLVEFEGVRVPGPTWNYILPDSHHFAKRKRLRLAELRDEAFVSLDEHQFPGFGILLLEACRLAGFVPQVSVYARSWSEAIAHVMAGRGITIAPRSAIAIPLAAEITMIHADLNPEWYALWNGSNGNPQLRPFIQLLLDAPPPDPSSMRRALPPLGASRFASLGKGTTKPRSLDNRRPARPSKGNAGGNSATRSVKKALGPPGPTKT